ncbi:hypothetical protein K2X05_13100 [bacterium]|nr:hypothetical protein [bacterium]
MVLWLFPISVHAQQSFFNAFSSDRTQTHNHFYQAQTNISNHNMILNNTYDYGINDSLELGLNWFDIPVSSISGFQSDEEVLFNAQYFYQANSTLQLSVGAQMGLVHDSNFRDRYGQLIYVNSKWLFSDLKTKFVAGILKGNNYYLNSPGVLFQLGLETAILEKKLYFVTDYISGKTENSVGVIGFSYFLNHSLILSLGYQYPSYKSDNSYGAVMELTYNPE